MKEETRIEGPWEYGTKPKINQCKSSVDDARKAKAEANMEILKMGAETAV